MHALVNFLEHPLAQKLLKYDVTFHGGIAAEVLSGRPIENY